MKERLKAKEIFAKLRQVEVRSAQGRPVEETYVDIKKATQLPKCFLISASREARLDKNAY